MELNILHKRVIALDIHQAPISACALLSQEDGTVRMERRPLGAFKRDRREWAEWARSLCPDEVVMESTGIYWKSPYAALSRTGLLRGSFIAPAQLRELRLVSRQRQKLSAQLAAEKNRLHKVLTDSGGVWASWSVTCRAKAPAP